jgi:chloramphenicol 3-O phosphotransferase
MSSLLNADGAQYGRVVLLNGTSSAGKTTLARALQRALLPEIWFHIQVDLLRDAHPDRNLAPPGEAPRGITATSFLRAIPASLRALAAHGDNLIIDDVFGPTQLKNYVEAFTVSPSGLRPLFVYVGCDKEALDRREAARGDRDKGTARGLLRLVRAPGVWDVEVDTTNADPDALAGRIVARLRSGEPADAFERLARMDLGQVIRDAEEVRWAETTLVNRSERPLFLYMIDIWGEAQLRDTVAPGGTVTRRMSNFHPWEVRDESGAVLSAFTPDGQDRRFALG